MHRSLPAACLLLCLFCMTGLAGCAQNSLPLHYPVTASPLAATGTPHVTVVLFSDAREKEALGERRNGRPFESRSSVDYWFLQAFAAELARSGLVVTYARNLDEAYRSRSDYIVSGVIDEIWLVESSLTLYRCAMRASFSLRDANGAILHKNSYTANLSRRVLPTSDAPAEILTETLQELVIPAARMVESSIAGK